MTLPAAFEERMLRLLGQKEYASFREALEQEKSRGLRLNPLKLPKEVDPACLGRELGGGLTPIPWAAPYGFFYPQELRPGKSPLHEAGLYYLQEPSAMSAAALADARPGEKILDLCAAPGGKSTQLAGAMKGQGLLVSNEIHPARAKILSQNMERWGAPNAVVTNESPEKLAARFASYFDKVLVDAPCSGEGMFRKEEQALSGWSKENVALCAQRQQAILEQAAVMVKAGGRLIYSTCTFAPAEDEETIAGFLRGHSEFELTDLPSLLGDRMKTYGFDTGHPEWCSEDPAVRSEDPAVCSEVGKAVRLWPHRLNGEGHFVAVLQKKGMLLEERIPRSEELFQRDNRSRRGAKARPGASPGRGSVSLPQAVSELEELALQKGVLKRFADAMGGGLICFGEEVYLMPCKAQIAADGLRILRPGLQLAAFKKNRLEPAHALAMALRPQDALRVVELAPEDPKASAFLRGESLPCDPSLKGWTLVTTAGVSMGWGKAAGGMLKNHYPKGLRRF